MNTTVNSSLEAVVCHGDADNTLCCNFNVSFTVNGSLNSSNSYVYHLVAFNGVRTYSGVYYGGVETCGVVACLNHSVTSCGQRLVYDVKLKLRLCLWQISELFVHKLASDVQQHQRYREFYPIGHSFSVAHYFIKFNQTVAGEPVFVEQSIGQLFYNSMEGCSVTWTTKSVVDVRYFRERLWARLGSFEKLNQWGCSLGTSSFHYNSSNILICCLLLLLLQIIKCKN